MNKALKSISHYPPPNLASSHYMEGYQDDELTLLKEKKRKKLEEALIREMVALPCVQMAETKKRLVKIWDKLE